MVNAVLLGNVDASCADRRHPKLLFVLMMMSVFCLQAVAAEYWIRPTLDVGSADWSKAACYQMGPEDSGSVGRDPQPEDVIVLPERFKLAVTNGTPAYAFFSSVSRIALCNGAELEVAVLEGTAQWKSAVNRHDEARATDCRLVKSGAGRLELKSAGTCVVDGRDYDYRVGMDVRQGVLKLVDAASGVNLNRWHFSLNVAADATLVVGSGASEIVEGLMTGSGTVINEAGVLVTVNVRGNSTAGYCSEFSGRILGKICMSVTGFRLDLTGTENTYDGQTVFYRTSERNGFVGFRTWGGESGQSSLGVGGISFAEAGGLINLGETIQSGSKSVYMNEPGVSVDGGVFGGLTISTTFGAYSANTNNMYMTFCGSNTEHECVYTGKFNDQYAYRNPGAGGALGPRVSHRIIKDGPGIWRFANNANRLNAGVIEVNDGTLRFDSIAETNVVCSLGLATALFSKYYGPIDESRRVTQAFELGGSEGRIATMEYTGTAPGVCTTRPFALKGDGRLLAESGALDVSGFGTLDGAPATLRLAGESTAGNTVRDVRHDDGRVTVVKEGGGTWTLGGELSFAGDVRIDAGTLAVARPTSYTWYRFVLKENYSAQQKWTSTTWQNNYFQFKEIGLFDKDGNRINVGLTQNKSYQQTKSLEPGTFGLANYNGTACSWDRDPLGLFDDDIETPIGGKANTLQLSSGVKPNISTPSTWPTVVMRLSAAAAPAASYDIVSGDSTSDAMAITFWSVEGSFDGVNWTEVATCDKTKQRPVADGKWYNGGVDFAPRQIHEGYALSSVPVKDVFTNVDSVQVAAGATLRTSDEVTLRGLAFGANGAGVIDGFGFAAHGTLRLPSRPKTTMALPGEYRNVSGLANLVNWNVICGDKPFRGTVTYKDGQVILVTPGCVLFVR